MRFSLLASVVAMATGVMSGVIITETRPAQGVCWETGTVTKTKTLPGVTSTVYDPATVTSTSTVYTLPTPAGGSVQANAPHPQERALPTDYPTTIIEVIPCSSTTTATPTITTIDVHVTTATTVFASTVTETFTYTLCIPGHRCL